MDTTQLELELLDLEALYERTRSKITKAELADKITLKKKEIREAKTVEQKKNVVPTRNAPSRMDHSDKKVKSAIKLDADTFKINF